jgi:hypothetical protein
VGVAEVAALNRAGIGIEGETVGRSRRQGISSRAANGRR